MSLHLLRLEPDAKALSVWATKNGMLSDDGDFGYALHALLATAFGNLAPKPFRYFGDKRGLLAYTTAELDEMRLYAALAAPDIARALGLGAFDAKPFPSAWRVGQRIGFEARVRPIVRTKDGRERDVFLHTVSNSDEIMPDAEGALALRQGIYASWLAKQFASDNAADLESVRMESFALTRVLRKGAARDEGKRKSTQASGPDVVFKGSLLIKNTQAFYDLLRRGLGRHRSFGFGMLLLRPADQC